MALRRTGSTLTVDFTDNDRLWGKIDRSENLHQALIEPGGWRWFDAVVDELPEILEVETAERVVSPGIHDAVDFAGRALKSEVDHDGRSFGVAEKQAGRCAPFVIRHECFEGIAFTAKHDVGGDGGFLLDTRQDDLRNLTQEVKILDEELGVAFGGVGKDLESGDGNVLPFFDRRKDAIGGDVVGWQLDHLGFGIGWRGIGGDGPTQD